MRSMASQKLTFSIPHKLSQDEARQRIAQGVDNARQKLTGGIAQVRETWAGNRMDFALSAFGGQMTGRAEVEATSVRIEIDLPWALAMLAPKVRAAIEEEGRKALEKK